MTLAERNDLVVENLKMIDAVVNELSYLKLPFVIDKYDFYGQCYIAIIEAIESYDKNKSDNIRHYIYWYLRYSILSYYKKIALTRKGKNVFPISQCNNMNEIADVDFHLENYVYNKIILEKFSKICVEKLGIDVPKLRIEGYTYDEIAEKAKKSKHFIHKYFIKILTAFPNKIKLDIKKNLSFNNIKHLFPCTSQDIKKYTQKSTRTIQKFFRKCRDENLIKQTGWQTNGRLKYKIYDVI